MADKDNPEAGERCTVKTADGEETAVWTGHVWAADDGSRLIDAEAIQSWEAAPIGGDLEVRMPDGKTQKVNPEVVGNVEDEAAASSDGEQTGER